jgi:hypothetical protein
LPYLDGKHLGDDGGCWFLEIRNDHQYIIRYIYKSITNTWYRSCNRIFHPIQVSVSFERILLPWCSQVLRHRQSHQWDVDASVVLSFSSPTIG